MEPQNEGLFQMIFLLIPGWCSGSSRYFSGEYIDKTPVIYL